MKFKFHLLIPLLGALLFGNVQAMDAACPATGGEKATANLEKSYFDSPDQVRMSFVLVGNLIVVEAEVNGQRGNFILDTGAEDLLLNRAHFRGQQGRAETVSSGATGKINEVGTLHLKRFHWQGVEIGRRDVETVDLSHVEDAISRKVLGLIGYEVLRRFEVKLDYLRQEVTLYRLNGFGNRMNKSPQSPTLVVPFQLPGTVPVLRASAGGKKLRFALDSGASANMMSNKLKPRHFHHFKLEKQVRLAGAGDETWDVLAGTLSHFQLGDHTFAPMRTVVADTRPLEEAFNSSIHGVLGYEFLRQYIVSINYQRGELIFWN